MVGPKRASRRRSGKRRSGGSGYYNTRVARAGNVTMLKHRGVRVVIQQQGSGYKGVFYDPSGVDQITIKACTRDEAITKAKAAVEAIREKQRIDFNQRHGVKRANLHYKATKAIPLETLMERERLKWNEMHEMEKRAGREGWTREKEHAERIKIVKKWEPLLKRPDLRPIIYRTTIGHYGGMFVEVPEEHFADFKSYFPPKEFPRTVKTLDVREKLTFEGEKHFRARFPNSNRVKEVYFSDRSKGLKRLDFMETPRTDEW